MLPGCGRGLVSWFLRPGLTERPYQVVMEHIILGGQPDMTAEGEVCFCVAPKLETAEAASRSGELRDRYRGAGLTSDVSGGDSDREDLAWRE